MLVCQSLPDCAYLFLKPDAYLFQFELKPGECRTMAMPSHRCPRWPKLAPVNAAQKLPRRGAAPCCGAKRAQWENFGAGWGMAGGLNRLTVDTCVTHCLWGKGGSNRTDIDMCVFYRILHVTMMHALFDWKVKSIFIQSNLIESNPPSQTLIQYNLICLYSFFFIPSSDSKISKRKIWRICAVHDGESQEYHPSFLRSGTTTTNDTASCAKQWEDPVSTEHVLPSVGCFELRLRIWAL